jgi:hypothetical protein
MILSIILLFVGLFIIFYSLVKLNNNNVEKFQTSVPDPTYVVRELRADSINDLESLTIDGDISTPKNIFVGEPNESIFPSTNNSLATNNTLFIKDRIQVGVLSETVDDLSETVGVLSETVGDLSETVGVLSETVTLDLEKIKRIKYLPYNFKDQLCLGSSCINKHHIKLIKGRKPFKLNTFISAKPFRIFSEPGYGGWSMGVTTEPNSNISLQGNGVKSVRISDPNYIMSAYSEPNYQGSKIEIGGEGSADLTATFPNGFRSYQAKSASGNLLKNFCFQHSQIIHAPDTYNNVIQAVPCDQSSDVYYIVREDDINNEEHGGNCEVDFHVHMGNQGYHHDSCQSDN